MGKNECGGHRLIKYAYPVIIKLYPDFFRSSWNVGNMNMDGIGLANSVESADPLLDELGVFREIPEDEVMRKLEVTPFATDLGTEEYAGPFGIGKVGGLAVALD